MTGWVTMAMPVIWSAAFMLMVPPPVSPAGGPVVAPLPVSSAAVRDFGDWSVACDNGGNCTAISLSRAQQAKLAAQDPGDLARPVMRVSRQAGWHARPEIIVDLKVHGEVPAAVITRLRLAPPVSGAIFYGRHRRENFALIALGNGEFGIAADDIDAFFNAAQHSRSAVVRTAEQQEFGLLSLDGMVSAINFIDQQQHRALSTTAIYTEGPNLVPSAAIWPPAVPVLQAVRGIRVEEAVFEQTTAPQQYWCSRPAYPAKPIPASRHGADMADGSRIIGVHCDNDTVNPRSLWFVRPSISPSRLIELPLENGTATQATSIGIPNSDFDPETGQLQSIDYHRAQRDCGIWRRWLWTTRGFMLMETRVMPVCMGVAPPGWLRIWTSE